ncbi:hypothetical protein JCM11641_001770 [Rhodosporidiobolus odoratus]
MSEHGPEVPDPFAGDNEVRRAKGIWTRRGRRVFARAERFFAHENRVPGTMDYSFEGQGYPNKRDAIVAFLESRGAKNAKGEDYTYGQVRAYLDARRKKRDDPAQRLKDPGPESEPEPDARNGGRRSDDYPLPGEKGYRPYFAPAGEHHTTGTVPLATPNPGNAGLTRAQSPWTTRGNRVFARALLFFKNRNEGPGYEFKGTVYTRKTLAITAFLKDRRAKTRRRQDYTEQQVITRLAGLRKAERENKPELNLGDDSEAEPDPLKQGGYRDWTG